MGKWVHRLSNVDLQAMKADCVACGRITVYRSGNNVRCATSKRLINDAYAKRGGKRATENIRRKYVAEVGHCERCGFVPAHSCQLDCDHRNGDWTDNENNWWVLCANCHRLKSYHPELFWSQVLK